MKTIVRFFFLFYNFQSTRNITTLYTLVSWTVHDNSEKIGNSVGHLALFCFIFRDNGSVQLENLQPEIRT